MDADTLYAELGLQFQPGDRHLYLQELADIARDYRSALGPEERRGGATTALQDLTAELGKESVVFSPTLPVRPLTMKLISDLHVEIPPHVGNLLRVSRFYLVDFPITMFPRPGWAFVRLDCIVEFNPGATSPKRPTAYQIFPDEKWEEVMRAWQGFKLGVDENLEFKLDPAVAADK